MKYWTVVIFWLLCYNFTLAFSLETKRNTLDKKQINDSTKNYSIKIIDSITKEPITSVIVYFMNVNKLLQISSSNDKGEIQFRLKASIDSVTASFKHISYHSKTITFSTRNTPVKINLKTIYTLIDTINISKTKKKDLDTLTIILDSAVTKNYNTKKALLQINGFHIKDNLLYYKLQPISNVLVNGEVFFYNNPNDLLNLLPAYVVNKVQIYDTKDSLSIQSNNELYTEINLLTHDDKKNGIFGNLDFSKGTKKTTDIGYNLFLTKEKNKFHSKFSRNNIAKYWDSNLLSLRNIQPTEGQIFNDFTIKHNTNILKSISLSNDLSYSISSMETKEAIIDSIIQENSNVALYTKSYSRAKNNNISYSALIEHRSKFTQIQLNPMLYIFQSNNIYDKSLFQEGNEINTYNKNIITSTNINVSYSQLLNLGKKNRKILINLNLSQNKDLITDSLKQKDSKNLTSSQTKKNETNNFSNSIQYSDLIFKKLNISLESSYSSKSNKTVTNTHSLSSSDVIKENYSTFNYYNLAKFRFTNNFAEINSTILWDNLYESYLTPNGKNKRTISNILLNIHSTYHYKNITFNIAYNQSNLRPTIQQILSTPRIINTTNIYIGNPNLKIGKSNNINLSITNARPSQLNSFNLNFNLNYSQDGILETTNLLNKDTIINSILIPIGTIIISPLNSIRQQNKNVVANYFFQDMFLENSSNNINLSYSNFNTTYGSLNYEKRKILSFSNSFQYNTNTLKLGIDYNFILNDYKSKNNEGQFINQQIIRNRLEYYGLSLFNVESSILLELNKYEQKNRFNQIYWNAIIHRHILKNDKLKFQFSINNILNAKENYSYNIVNNLISQRNKIINGRFWIFMVSYKISKFGI